MSAEAGRFSCYQRKQPGSVQVRQPLLTPKEPYRPLRQLATAHSKDRKTRRPPRPQPENQTGMHHPPHAGNQWDCALSHINHHC
jgi:hypothetical protein